MTRKTSPALDMKHRKLSCDLWRYQREVKYWPLLGELPIGTVLRRQFKGKTLELIVGDECYYDRSGRVYGCLKEYMAEHIATVDAARPGKPRIIRDMSQRPKRFWGDAVARALAL